MLLEVAVSWLPQKERWRAACVTFQKLQYIGSKKNVRFYLRGGVLAVSHSSGWKATTDFLAKRGVDIAVSSHWTVTCSGHSEDTTPHEKYGDVLFIIYLSYVGVCDSNPRPQLGGNVTGHETPQRICGLENDPTAYIEQQEGVNSVVCVKGKWQ